MGMLNPKGENSMVEQDTIKLLRECDAGVRMGTASIDDVLDHVRDDAFRSKLTDCKQQHNQLQDELQRLLDRYQDEGKHPSPMAKGMAKMKTSMKLTMEHTDATIADLMTDGCNMGVKSLSRYLNEYAAADEQSKDIAKRLISLEEGLAKGIRGEL